MKLWKKEKIKSKHRTVGLTGTGKIWDLESPLRAELIFEQDLVLPITTQALEASLLSELDKKNETCFTEADATLYLYQLC